MANPEKKVEVRFGAFACSIEGYDNPVEQMREILGMMQKMIAETPALAETSEGFDPDPIEDALAGGEGDVTPGVVVIHNEADDREAPGSAPGGDGDEADARETAPATAEDDAGLADDRETVGVVLDGQGDEADASGESDEPVSEDSDGGTGGIAMLGAAAAVAAGVAATARAETAPEAAETNAAGDEDLASSVPGEDFGALEHDEAPETNAEADVEADPSDAPEVSSWSPPRDPDEEPESIADADPVEAAPDTGASVQEDTPAADADESAAHVGGRPRAPWASPGLTSEAFPASDGPETAEAAEGSDDGPATTDAGEPSGEDDGATPPPAKPRLRISASPVRANIRRGAAPAPEPTADAAVAETATSEPGHGTPQAPAARPSNIFAPPPAPEPETEPAATAAPRSFNIFAPPEPTPAAETAREADPASSGDIAPAPAGEPEAEAAAAALSGQPSNIFAPPPPVEPAPAPEPEPVTAVEPAPQPSNIFAPPPAPEPAPEEPPTSDGEPPAEPSNIFAAPPAPEPEPAPGAETAADPEPRNVHPIFAPPSADPAPHDAEPATQLENGDQQSAGRFQNLLQRVHGSSVMGAPGETPDQMEFTTPDDLPPPVLDAPDATDLAARAGDPSTAGQLAASAAWLTLVQNRSSFSRREVMEVLDTIPSDQPRELADRIKGFGRLVRSGRLVLVGDGLFAMAQADRDRFSTLVDQR